MVIFDNLLKTIHNENEGYKMVTNRLELTKEELYQLYVKEQHTTSRISTLTGFNREYIEDKIKEYRLTRSGKPRRIKERVESLLGYVSIDVKGKRVLEHRWIWEQANGPIPRGWIIHHINGLRNDNRLVNLLAIPRGRHSTKYITEATKKRIVELDTENTQLKELISAYEEYICKMPK